MAASGYECEFVESVQEFECPLCLHVTREPHQTNCCGHDFCQGCINRVLTDNKPCPFCRTRLFTVFNDRRQRRRVMELKVYCTTKDKGCSWIGELCELDSHLDPTNDKCQYIHINCTSCGKTLQRRLMRNHRESVCPKRAFTCQYCSYTATYEDVRDKHWPVCTKYPLLCPNDCSIATVERGTLRLHLRECPLQLVQCEFSHVGCSEKIRRRDMRNHLQSECSKRDFTCKFCGYSGTFEEVSGLHSLVVCSKYPLPCPNDCGIGTVERGSREKHLRECPLQLVQCEFSHLGCSEKIRRRDMRNHLQSECSKRDFTCQYCGFMATFEDVHNKHMPVCTMYPLPCPNNCGIGTVERDYMGLHLRECPLQLVQCKFSHVGCSEQIRRKDIQRHMISNMHIHLVMTSTALSQKDEIQRELAETNKEMQRKLAEKEKEMQRQIAEKDAEMQRQIAEKDEEMHIHDVMAFTTLSQKEDELQRKLAEKDTEMQSKLAEKDREMQRELAEKDTEMQRKLAEKDTQMQRKLAETKEEMQSKLAEKDTEMQRELGKMYVEMQRELIKKHMEMRTKLAEKDTEIKRTLAEMNKEMHRNLAEKDKEIERRAKLLNSEFPPVDFTVHSYSHYEGNHKRWDQCPYFYTHCIGAFVLGAKIKIALFMHRLHLNQVDIELWQVPGEFDEAIDWPVRCTVTVQILNQMVDKNHLRFSRDYELNRIQYRPRSCGDIAHHIHCSTLRPPQHDIQYVKEDCLRIRAKVVLK